MEKLQIAMKNFEFQMEKFIISTENVLNFKIFLKFNWKYSNSNLNYMHSKWSFQTYTENGFIQNFLFEIEKLPFVKFNSNEKLRIYIENVLNFSQFSNEILQISNRVIELQVKIYKFRIKCLNLYGNISRLNWNFTNYI